MSLICSSEYWLRPIAGRRRPENQTSGGICRPLRRRGRGGDENGANGRQVSGLSTQGVQGGPCPLAWGAFAQRFIVYVRPRVYCRRRCRTSPRRLRSGNGGVQRRSRCRATSSGVGAGRAGVFCRARLQKEGSGRQSSCSSQRSHSELEAVTGLEAGCLESAIVSEALVIGCSAPSSLCARVLQSRNRGPAVAMKSEAEGERGFA